MKQTYLVVMALFCLTISFNRAQAQIWSEFAPIFEQLDDTERVNFAEELQNLMDSWHYGSVELNSIVDSLFNGQSIYDPGAPIDSMLTAWMNNRAELVSILDGSGVSIMDSLAVLGEFDRVNDIWDMNLDSLNEVLELYSDSTAFSPGLAQEAVRRFEVFQGLWTQIFSDLQESVQAGFDTTNPQGIGNLGETLDTLFSDIFDLEIAYGQEFADIRYYDESYSVTANVIRLASVPHFDRDWEAQWYIKGSFFNATDDILDNGVNLQPGFNGLLCDGGFSLLYNPMISCTRGVTIRLYSSLGMAFSTYVPAHVRDFDPRTQDNVGKTTGYGPQMGAGAIINVGPATLYTYGTLATGDVVNGNDYRFNARSANAGIRYGDEVNILYSYGKTRWAPNNNKMVDYHRVTVGIILSALNR